MKLTYKHTRIACYANFFSTAVCIALMGLLLTSLRREFGLDMGRLSLLVGMLSLMQIILVPVMTAAANRAGFRPMMIFAQVFFFPESSASACFLISCRIRTRDFSLR